MKPTLKIHGFRNQAFKIHGFHGTHGTHANAITAQNQQALLPANFVAVCKQGLITVCIKSGNNIFHISYEPVLHSYASYFVMQQERR